MPGIRAIAPTIAARVSGRRSSQPDRGDQDRAGERQRGRVGAHEIRQANEDAERGVGLGAEILQHRRKLRQHEQDEEQHHADRRDQHEQRILHRVRQLAAHLFGARPLRTQQLQHLVERAGDLADPHQRHIHRRKQRRMRADRLGKSSRRSKAPRATCRPPGAAGRHRHRSRAVRAHRRAARRPSAAARDRG